MLTPKTKKGEKARGIHVNICHHLIKNRFSTTPRSTVRNNWRCLLWFAFIVMRVSCAPFIVFMKTTEKYFPSPINRKTLMQRYFCLPENK